MRNTWFTSRFFLSLLMGFSLQTYSIF